MTRPLPLEDCDDIRKNHVFNYEGVPGIHAFLKQEWSLTLGGTAADEWFDRLYTLHTEKSRFYHTVVHLQEMLKYIGFLQGSGVFVGLGEDVPEILRIATFFHDAIYNATSSTNEKDSANLFREFCQAVSIKSTVQAAVDVLILATEKHAVAPSEFVGEHIQRIFLDIDMAVLGKCRDAYLAYAGLIREEYIHVPRDLYCEKRAQVLEAFCSRRVFLSDEFHEALETVAKENMKCEIVMLRRGVIPCEKQ
eukprot:Nitzschia sp. Nitz4//scaffold76_size158648//5929//6678//NITZ4_002525-RA/size158648-processed-gene-0.223-mRNA-1//1//CDS//3329557782//6081//frame0